MPALRQPGELDGAELRADEHELGAHRLGLLPLRSRLWALLFMGTALELRPKPRAKTDPHAVDSCHTPTSTIGVAAALLESPSGLTG
jgi:hypothetical protein